MLGEMACKNPVLVGECNDPGNKHHCPAVISPGLPFFFEVEGARCSCGESIAHEARLSLRAQSCVLLRALPEAAFDLAARGRSKYACRRVFKLASLAHPGRLTSGGSGIFSWYPAAPHQWSNRRLNDDL